MSRLAIAGKELMKGNIGNAITAIATKSGASELFSMPVQPSRWRNGNFFFGVNGADKYFIWGNYNSSLVAYQTNPIVSAVIHKQAQALVNGKQLIMTGDGKTAKEATTTQAKALRQLLKRPNPIQNGKEFRAQASVYKRIYGYCAILKIVPVGFEDDFSRWKLWNIPPWMVQVEDNTTPFWESSSQPFKSIRLTYMGYSVNLPMESVVFIKENQISTGTYNMASTAPNVSLFLPDSKLLSLTANINSFNASLNSRGSIIANRGPQWLLTNDSADSPDSGVFPVDPKEKDNVQTEFLQYGMMSGQRKAIITDAKLKLQTVGFDVRQMQLLEGEVQDAKTICDGLNYPPYLLGLVDAKFDNQAIAERSLYTNSIIPDAESEDEQWAEKLFGLEALGLRLFTDYSHLPALQENITEQGRGRWYMNQGILIEWLQDGITWNRWRELLGEDAVDGMDIYYSDMVKMGRINPPAPTKNPAEPAPGNVQTDSAQAQLEAIINQHAKSMSDNGLADAVKQIRDAADRVKESSINLIKHSSNGHERQAKV